MKNKLKILSIVIILIMQSQTFLQSQTPQWQWVKGGGSQGSGWGSSPAMESCKWLGTDARGNIYGMSSIFNFNIQIDTSVKATGWGYDDFAVFSYRCDGSLRWVRYYGSSSQDFTGGFTVDQEGNTYVSGFVMINDIVNGNFGDTTVLSNSTMNCGYFISKLDSNGHTNWLKLLGNTQFALWNQIIQMEADNQGNQCMLIKFYETGNWGNYTIPQKGYYVVKVDKNNGNTMSVTKLDFNASDNISGLYFGIDESNNYYLNTQVSDTIFAGSNIIVNTYAIDHYLNYILIKYSATGGLLWYKELGGKPGIGYLTEKMMIGKPIIKNNKVYINGAANNHLSVFGDTINNPYLNISYQRIPMNICFNKNNGDFISLIHLYNTNYCDFISVTTITDKIYLANSAGRAVMLNQTDTIKPFSSVYGKAYPFVVAIDTNHTQFEWGIATKVSGDDTRIEALTVDNTGNIYAGGRLTDSIYNSFGGGIQSHGGSSDFFIAKISSNNNCGCALAIPSLQLQSLNNNILTVKGSATGLTDSLYWFWGDGSKTKYLTQNTNVSHTYATGGNYNVCLKTYNICGSKDACMQVNGVGIQEQELKYLTVYPNPVKNTLIVENPYLCSMQLSIYSITGKLLYSNTYENDSISLDMSNYEAGFYLVDMKLADGRRAVRKVAKE
ncbi:MAG: T9SS type A sorting domain-containing protein [Bacteroidales bacterium]